jgi:hypothetical protein
VGVRRAAGSGGSAGPQHEQQAAPALLHPPSAGFPMQHLRADATGDGRNGSARRQRRLWAYLLRRVCEVDPLTCRRCGSPLRVVVLPGTRGHP